MKKSNILLTSLLASSIAVTGIHGTANAEENGAKTVTGETLPSSTDPDGDGWANMDFDISALPQTYQDEITQLTQQKDSGELSQVNYNEKVASIFEQAKEEQQAHQTTQGNRPYGGVKPDGMSNEDYQQLENNVPNPTEVSPEVYEQAITNETQKIANKNNQSINTPQGVVTPNAQDNQMEQPQNLPDTGQQNNAEILSISAGLLALTAGLSLLMFKNRFVNKSK